PARVFYLPSFFLRYTICNSKLRRPQRVRVTESREKNYRVYFRCAPKTLPFIPHRTCFSFESNSGGQSADFVRRGGDDDDSVRGRKGDWLHFFLDRTGCSGRDGSRSDRTESGICAGSSNKSSPVDDVGNSFVYSPTVASFCTAFFCGRGLWAGDRRLGSGPELDCRKSFLLWLLCSSLAASG